MKNAIGRTALLVLLASLSSIAAAQEPTDTVDKPSFDEYDPPSTLVVPATETPRAKYPFVDVHSHQWRMPEQDLGELTAEMDSLNMAVMVNLSGRGFRRVELPDGSTRFGLNDGAHLAGALENVENTAPNRFLVFTNLDLEGFGSDGWTERAVAQLEADVAAGAAGLKIFKSLGLDAVDVYGERIATDDPRLDPVWAKCGELGIPVLIHTGEPATFWLPKDETNERLLEMIEKPDRWRGDPAVYPSWECVMEEQHEIFRRHPDTTFINAHFGWLAGDLGRLGELLDEMPNVYVEFGAVIAELGRQPRFAREWMTKYKDRILFGKDSWAPDEYPLYFRVLETDDDYINYFRARHAFWRVYGLDLPDDVLRAIYYENALLLFPQIDQSLFPAD